MRKSPEIVIDIFPSPVSDPQIWRTNPNQVQQFNASLDKLRAAIKSLDGGQPDTPVTLSTIDQAVFQLQRARLAWAAAGVNLPNPDPLNFFDTNPGLSRKLGSADGEYVPLDMMTNFWEQRIITQLSQLDKSPNVEQRAGVVEAKPAVNKIT